MRHRDRLVAEMGRQAQLALSKLGTVGVLCSGSQQGEAALQAAV